MEQNFAFGRVGLNHNRWIIPNDEPLAVGLDMGFDPLIEDPEPIRITRQTFYAAASGPTYRQVEPDPAPKKNYLEGCPFKNSILYEKIPLEIPPSRMLSPGGVEEFRWFINDKVGLSLRYTDVTDLLGLEFDDPHHRIDFGGGKEEKCGGKFVNRFCQWYYHSTNGYRELSNTFKEELNNRLSSFWIGGEDISQHKFYIDVVDKVDWESGAFGERSSEYEDGSCWWYSGGLESDDSIVTRFCALMPHRALGVRLWLEDEEGLRGVGRVWVIRNGSSPIFFNGYGFTTPAWVTHLSPLFGFKQWRKAPLVLDSRYFPSNTVNKGIGIVVDSQETVFSLKFVKKDFHWENTLWWGYTSHNR